MVELSPFCVEHGSYICKYVHKYLAFVVKGHHLVCFFSIPHLFIMYVFKLLYMYAICPSLYGFSLSVR